MTGGVSLSNQSLFFSPSVRSLALRYFYRLRINIQILSTNAAGLLRHGVLSLIRNYVGSYVVISCNSIAVGKNICGGT